MFKRLLASRKRPYIPGLDAFETLEINLSGNKFSIALPPHSGPWELDPIFQGSSIDIFNRELYPNLDHLPDYENDRLPVFVFLKRAVSFFGAPWEKMGLGYLQCFASICRVDALPANMSCFNPGHFEQVIAYDLYYNFGPAQVSSTKKSAPHNWRAIQQGEPSWIYCETQPTLNDPGRTYPDYEKSCFDILLYTPIDDQYFLQVSFELMGYSPSFASINAMRKVIEKILPSINITLSSNASRQQSQVLTTAKQRKYSQEKALEPWVHHQWRWGDRDLGEGRIAITKKGTPLPQLIPD